MKIPPVEAARVAVEQRLPVDAGPSLGTMADPDYADLFVMTGDVPGDSPERWARAMFDDVAGLTGQLIWRGILRLRLAPRAAPGHIAGWRIADANDLWVRLEARGPLVSGQLVVEVGEGKVSLATTVRYDRPPAAWIWSRLSAVHRRKAPALLCEALALLATDQLASRADPE